MCRYRNPFVAKDSNYGVFKYSVDKDSDKEIY